MGSSRRARDVPRATYEAWMRFAALLQQVVTTVLFGLVYLLVVPVFAVVARVLDPLKLRRRRGQESFWIPRARARLGPDELRRMG